MERRARGGRLGTKPSPRCIRHDTPTTAMDRRMAKVVNKMDYFFEDCLWEGSWSACLM